MVNSLIKLMSTQEQLKHLLSPITQSIFNQLKEILNYLHLVFLLFRWHMAAFPNLTVSKNKILLLFLLIFAIFFKIKIKLDKCILHLIAESLGQSGCFYLREKSHNRWTSSALSAFHKKGHKTRFNEIGSMV